MMQAASLSAEIELGVSAKTGPIMFLLASAHGEAVDAFMALSKVDPTKPELIRALQDDIRFYHETAQRLAHAVALGNQAMQALSPDDLQEMVETFSASDEDHE